MNTPKFYDVPRGTQPRACSSNACGMRVYWIITENGKRMPVDCDTQRVLKRTGEPGAFPPTDREAGRGISHYATCPSAETFRKEKR